MKKKIPYLDQFQSIDEAFNYLAKELNATRVSSSEAVQTDIGPQLADGEAKSVSFVHPGGPTTIVSVTVSHSLGTIPRAVLYAGQVHAIDIFDGNPIVWRVSSLTTTNVTLEMRIVSGTKTHDFFILK
jgi:hypothetical protein